MVPIPEGVERDEEEPTEDFDFGFLKNSGGDERENVESGLNVVAAE